jgi:hypothetical protein
VTFDNRPSTTTGTNGIGIGGFVTGLLGLILCWIPILGVVLGALGVILGGVGTSRARREGSGAGLSVAGVVCGAIGFIIAVIIWIAAARILLSH